MAEYGSTWERTDLGGGRFSHVQHLRPIAYLRDGAYRPMVTDFADSGISERPHIVSAAPLVFSVAADGMRRLYIRDGAGNIDPARYAEIGAPLIKNASGQWIKPPLGSATRIGNRITWDTAQVRLIIEHGGHFAKLGIYLKKPGGTQWFPNNMQFAFPVGLSGLTRTGGTLYADGVPVMQLRAPHVEDMDNPLDVRPMEHDFVLLGGQWYVVFTLPQSLVSNPMSRVLVDPTLELQPDETTGLDTHINSVNTTFNYGTYTLIWCGKGAVALNRGMLQFDISGLPVGITITTGTLSLYVQAVSGSSSVEAHRALTQWYEGATGGGAPGAGENASTWNLRNQNGAVAWAGGAGGGSGSDFAASATGSVAMPTAGQSYDIDITADVAAWYSGTAVNYGVWLINSDEVNFNKIRQLVSSNGSTASQRPKLTVVYTLPGALLLAQHRYVGGWH